MPMRVEAGAVLNAHDILCLQLVHASTQQQSGRPLLPLILIGASTPIRPPAHHLLIAAGPTYEPIDAVRFIGNRSSGRLGIALAHAAATRHWPTTLLLGPGTLEPASMPGLAVVRFQSTSDLQSLLREHLGACDALVMAAAVADFRPKLDALVDMHAHKLSRTPSGLTLHLEPTPDLLAECSSRRRPNQVLIGFALEPQERLLESARAKVQRKKVDLIVANPLGTMNAEHIDATLVYADLSTQPLGSKSKAAFAETLLDVVVRLINQASAHPSPHPTETTPA
jgi:phosphopantothenoylcysteine decarboxylase/phosphopantothenate--cysteine ligase